VTRHTWGPKDANFWDLLVVVHGHKASIKLSPEARERSMNQALSIIGEHEDTLSGPYGYQVPPSSIPFRNSEHPTTF
jgi:hypothetical protein